MSEVKVAVNACIRDILHRQHWLDPDFYALRLAAAIEEGLRSGSGISGAIAQAMKKTATAFFRANRGARSTFPAQLREALATRGIDAPGMVGLLRNFKRLAERQLVAELSKNRHEDVGRSHLQTFLHSVGKTFREVPVGAGRTDLLIFLPDTEEIVETKIWRGQQYHNDGLEELSAYMAAEGLSHGYYVVFEFYAVEPATTDEATYQGRAGTIDVVFVHVPLTPPSGLGRARRKQKS